MFIFLIFDYNAGFLNSFFQNVNYLYSGESDTNAILRRHSIKQFEPKKLKSLMEKLPLIPQEYRYYYPQSSSEFNVYEKTLKMESMKRTPKTKLEPRSNSSKNMLLTWLSVGNSVIILQLIN